MTREMVLDNEGIIDWRREPPACSREREGGPLRPDTRRSTARASTEVAKASLGQDLETRLQSYHDTLMETDDLQAKLKILDTMGRLCLRRKQMKRAITYFTKQLDIVQGRTSYNRSENEGDPLVAAKILVNLAKVYHLGLNDTNMASKKYSKALTSLYLAFEKCHQEIRLACDQCSPTDNHICEQHTKLGNSISTQIERVKNAQAKLEQAQELALQHQKSSPADGQSAEKSHSNSMRSDTSVTQPPTPLSPVPPGIPSRVGITTTSKSSLALHELKNPPSNMETNERVMDGRLLQQPVPGQHFSPTKARPFTSVIKPQPTDLAKLPASPLSLSSPSPSITSKNIHDNLKQRTSTGHAPLTSPASKSGRSKNVQVVAPKLLSDIASRQSSITTDLSSSLPTIEMEGFEVSAIDLDKGVSIRQTSVTASESTSPDSRRSTMISAGSVLKGPSRIIVVVWFLIGAELFLDLGMSAIAVISLTETFECCEESIDFKAHGARLLGITVPFFALVYVEVVCLALSIKGYLGMTPRQREIQAVKRRMNVGCFSFLGSTWRQQLINFLLTFNPFFGFGVAYLLLYQSNRTECFLVMGLEGGSILLHWLSIYFEGLPMSSLAIAWHLIPVLPFCVTVLLVLNYLDRGGVCYFVEDAYFWYDGCLVCPNNTLPGEDGTCANDGALGVPGTYCGSNSTDGETGNFCFFGISGDDSDLAGLFRGSVFT